MPEEICRLVERLKEAEASRLGETQERHHKGEPGMQKSRVVYCPFCLGTGQRAGANAAQPAVVCPECGGRGFFDKPPELSSL